MSGLEQQPLSDTDSTLEAPPSSQIVERYPVDEYTVNAFGKEITLVIEEKRREGVLVGVEILARDRVTGKTLYNTIVAAEKDGTIAPFVVQTIDKAVCALQHVLEANTPEDSLVPVAINIPLHMLTDDLLAKFDAIDERDKERTLGRVTGQDGTRSRALLELLEVELTEREKFDPTYIPYLKALKEKGVKIVLDDFGAGEFPTDLFRHEGLEELPSLLHGVKIDASLLRDKDSQTFEGVVAMLTAMNIPYVVEGVEKRDIEEQSSRIKGCVVQGFANGTASTLAEFVKQRIATISSSAYTH